MELYNSRVIDRDGAVYIDLEDEGDNDNTVYSKWSELPDILLERIFSYLSIRQKYYASLVCRSWHRAFYLPYVWSQFVLEDSTLTRGRFNYYSGWQYVLDHLRTQMCLSQIGKHFRHLTFEPMLNFYNLYEFMNMVSWYTEQTHKEIVKSGVGTYIRSLKFTFPCNMSNRDETERIRLFGTGGKLLDALKRLMGNLKKLKKLELIDLMLDPREAQHLLDGVCENCHLTLHTLIVVNTTRVQYQILHAGVFLNLHVLIICPQNLGEDLVELLGNTQVRHLHILQNRYTPNDSTIKPTSGRAWKICRKSNPKLCVHLQVQSIKEKQLIWQEYAPVKTILYDSPQIGYVLDHLRTQMCLSQIGKHFRHLTFEPMLNFYNLYEFMNMVSWYTEQTHKEIVKSGVGTYIRSLKFTFPCNMSNRDETERIRLFGTGGKLLDALKRLMGNLKKLKKLELIDLMLDPREAQHLLDGVCENCHLTLHTLIVVNTTRVQYQILHAGVFLNLHVLIICPQNLGEDLVELLGNTQVRHLHILQNRYTPNDSTIKPTSGRAWKICRKSNPKLCVHLQVQSIKEKQLIWQEYAPVKTILYDSPQIGLQTDTLITAIELYKKDLKIYGHQSLPRFFRHKSFHERIDSSLLLLCRQCPSLKVLVVTERISTATVLLLAHTARKLKYLYIRGNAVVKRCDWPQSPEWSDEFYEWLKFNSRSYVLVEKEVSQILGYNWQMLTDKQFKNLHINLHNEGIL